ncbi:hypothetical protein [Parathalassolituus penaei]|uniref:Uncharacterized protein n=1 Tax=Parathalassolituus penaei TaxID=2997323 RepID=A0A9X3ISY1_9GAMM|nr:hypothetical protein [Parathalassolituus penaei]MCY0965720.1 hypothetical protein [Parathalassolituus penaei]
MPAWLTAPGRLCILRSLAIPAADFPSVFLSCGIPIADHPCTIRVAPAS